VPFRSLSFCLDFFGGIRFSLLCICRLALALIAGQIGRPGTGLHPLRGQNNVQGASDAGLIPMVYTEYQSAVGEP
jgi:predicted molibdopterin-dependent oxidoreductase YjgC